MKTLLKQMLTSKGMLSFLLSALFVAAWASCPPPQGSPGPCPTPNTGTFVGYGFWPCCDQTKACPINGTKWARFYKRHTLYDLDPGPDFLLCSANEIDLPTEPDECCGDPLGEPGVPAED